MAVESFQGSLEYKFDMKFAMRGNVQTGVQNDAQNKAQNANEKLGEREQAIKDAAGKVDAKSMMMQYTMEFELNISISVSTNMSAQGGIFGSAMNNPNKLNDILSGLDLKSIGYEGKNIQDLTPDEAKELISENGFFGVTKTSDRIADFIIAGAGDDIEKLKAGRSGILKGYDMAEKSWGDKLPDISNQTLQRALEKVDKRLAELGGSVLEENA